MCIHAKVPATDSLAVSVYGLISCHTMLEGAIEQACCRSVVAFALTFEEDLVQVDGAGWGLH